MATINIKINLYGKYLKELLKKKVSQEFMQDLDPE